MKNKLHGMITLIAGVILILNFAACDIFDNLPNAPTNVRAIAIASDAVVISWNAVSDAIDYVVYGSFNQNGTYTRIGTIEDTVALNSKITSGGVPIQAGTTIWYRVSARNSYGEGPQSAPVSATTISGTQSSNTSLDGLWESSNGTVVAITGNNGVYIQFGSRPLTQDAINKGFIKVGDQAFRNLTNTGGLTWTGQQRLVYRYDSAPDVAIRTEWHNTTITLSANGQTFSYYTPNSLTPTGTYTRR